MPASLFASRLPLTTLPSCYNSCFFPSCLPFATCLVCYRFQECTLTDVSAQDMVPPGRVMYLRRFKASPRASVAKQAQHRRNARSSKHIPNATNLPGLRQVTCSTAMTGHTHRYCQLKLCVYWACLVVWPSFDMHIVDTDCTRASKMCLPE